MGWGGCSVWVITSREFGVVISKSSQHITGKDLPFGRAAHAQQEVQTPLPTWDVGLVRAGFTSRPCIYYLGCNNTS